MPWKLYVDSRKRVKGARGGTDSDFAIALPYPIAVKGKCYIDVVLLSNTFYTIRAGECDRIYLDENVAGTKRVAIIAPGQYTVLQLKDALVAALNNGKAIGGQYRVTYMEGTNRFVLDIVTPSATDVFRIWQEEHLKDNAVDWTGVVSLTPNDLRSANRACGFLNGTFLISTYSAPNASTLGTAPDAPDVQPYKQLFIRSNLASGSSQSLGVNGETDIIRRVVTGNTPQQGMIHDVHANLLDCVKITGAPEYQQLWFQIIDVEGRVVSTHGHPVSFSVIFQDLDEEY